MSAKDIKTVKLKIIRGNLIHYFYICNNIIFLNYIKKETKKKYQVIYIDPPYNTKDNNKNYRDIFKDDEWTEQIKERLELARELLTNDGFIAISIGNNELFNLKRICDTIFGACNFISNMVRKTTQSGQPTRYISNNIDYILIYAKYRKHLRFRGKPPKEPEKFNFKDKYGDYTWRNFATKNITYNKERDYPIKINNQNYYAGNTSKEEHKKRYKNTLPGNVDWRWLEKKKWANFAIKHNLLEVRNNKVYKKRYRVLNKWLKPFVRIPQANNNCWLTDSEFFNVSATHELEDIFNGNVVKFQYPKPSELIKWIIKLHPDNNINVLDFYGGSGSTMHAVFKANQEDGGKRTGTICTLNENNIEWATWERLHNIIKGITPTGKEITWTEKNEPFLDNGLITYKLW